MRLCSSLLHGLSALVASRGRLLCGFVLAAAAMQASAQESGSLAFERAHHLQRGINASIWFAQAPGRYTAERLRTLITADDFALMHRLGFDHIRLSIDADPLVGWQRGTPEGVLFVGELDRVIREATAQQLAVVVDIHPESSYKKTLLVGNEGVQGFVTLWAKVAGHFSSTDPEMVFFEMMNEPEQTDPYRWQGIEAVTAEQIRRVAPRHTIIAAGAHWSGLGDLLAMAPLADPNVIYTFHDYEPFAFTHQGATWTDARVRPLRGVPYPSSPANVVKNEAQEPTEDGKLFVAQYGLDKWDAARVSSTLDFAQQWGEQHHVPVYCGEFGVYRPYAEAKARAAWLHDMRVALEAHHIGWAMWDYQDNFGLVTKTNGRAKADPAVVEALGLKAAP